MFFSCFDVCALFVCVPLLPSYNVHAVDLPVFITRIPRIGCVAWHKANLSNLYPWLMLVFFHHGVVI